jgi:alkylhydroperoxidase family enzyme
MAHLPGSADEIRGRVPAVLESYAFIRDNVLLAGPADGEVKQLCFRFLAGEVDPSAYEGRERAALDWAVAIAWDSDRADDALWERLHEHFTEEELVDLGCAIGFELGQQHFVRTLGLTPELPHAAA